MLLVHFGESFRNAVSLFLFATLSASQPLALPTFFIAGFAAIHFVVAWPQGGKHRAFMHALTVAAVSGTDLFLDYGTQPSSCFSLSKAFALAPQFLPIAMLAHVLDVDSARIGSKRACTYFAFLGFSEKIAIAFGTGVSLNIVGLLGFDPSGGVAASTDVGVWALRLVYCLGPIVFYGLAMRLIWNYPLTPARHKRLQERLARRTKRLAAKRAQSYGTG